MANKLSVEVYRDAATPGVDIAPVLDGVELINSLTNNALEITASSRVIQIGSRSSEELRLDSTEWPSLSRHITLIATSRPISYGTDRRPLGTSRRTLVPGIGSAIISSIDGTMSEQMATTTAHELGHILCMRYDENSRHCPDGNCVMAEGMEVSHHDVYRERHGIKKILEWAGYLPPEYETVTSATEQSFCHPCTEQLARRAFFLLKYHRGEAILKEWL